MKTATDQTQEGDLEFLPDKPTIEDAIGVHREIARNLKKVIMGGLPKPFVIGLYGSWGSGKSSIVEMLRTSSDRKFQIVVVDAWRKDKDNFLRQFVKKLANELLPSDSAAKICEDVDYKKSTQINSWIPGKFAKFAFVIFILVALYLLFGTIWNSFYFPSFPSKDVAPFEFLILTAIAFQWLLPKYSQQVQQQTTEITIEDPAWFRKIYFERILNEASGISACVVIDNLDRVPAEDALAIIKFIKTFIVDVEYENVAQNKTKITFLIPCDDRELINRIKNDGRDDGTAAEFLRKFINISLRIPLLLEQDNTDYIRGLIDKIGCKGNSFIIENMAFIVSRACGNNPRKPKTILNHFVARFNLAKNFPACWEIMRKRPDWFLAFCIMESESLGIVVSDQLEPSKRMSENMPPASSSAGFTESIRPILDEVSVEAWRTFLFLKKPNAHDLIPQFIEMVQFALKRNAEKFNEIFFNLLPEYPQLVNVLWSERKDFPSHMAFAERILWAYESSKNFQIPTPIENEISTMIQMSVTGWTYLPPTSTYELVIKSRPACLISVLGSFNLTNFDASENARDFLRTVTFFAMRDFAETGQYQNEIRAILELRAKDDVELANLGIKYPEYKSISVLQKNLDSLLQEDSKIRPQEIVQYVQEVSKLDKTLSNSWLQTIIFGGITAAFQQSRTEKQRLAAIELCSESVMLMERNGLGGNNQGVQVEASLFRALSSQYPICQRSSLWEGVYFIFSCNIAMFMGGSNQTLKNEAAQHCRNIRQNFLAAAPENLVEKILKQHALFFFEKANDQFLLQAICRSPNLARAGLDIFSKMRSQIISQLARSNPNWLKEGELEIKEDKP